MLHSVRTVGVFGPRFGQGYTAPKTAVRERSLVIVESPFANQNLSEMRANVQYAQKAMIDSLMFHGEAPALSHLLYTQVLDEDSSALNDQGETQRDLGINAGLAWRKAANVTVVYTDRGISSGMQHGIHAAQQVGNTVYYRSLEASGTESNTTYCGHKDQVEQIYTALANRARGLKVDIIG